jgi:Domain of unknown function (DUF5060)/Protein of unknown function (DUF4038)/Domain of unknown function (DUF5605)
MMKAGAMAAAVAALAPGMLSGAEAQQAKRQSGPAAEVEQWGVFEAMYRGPSEGNPFVDVELGAFFEQGAKSIKVDGFYDSGGVYRVRFMPDSVGVWRYRTRSNCPELDGKIGSFVAHVASGGNHGPVRVKDQYRFVYADGLPYRELGTTCYAWTSQPAAMEQKTLSTLATAPFNKMRMCVFPKWFDYNRVEPPMYPFVGQAPNHWEFTRFNPQYFQHLEKRIAQLGAMGIESDLILFHPYDEGHWGFDNMGAENDDRYLRYVIARLGASRNVWWSLANEWDYFKTKTEADFERIGETIAKNDPYKHLCSIHNQKTFFDHTKVWISHVSVQNDMPDNAPSYVRQYAKPVVFDECRYEGDISEGWGDITSERLVGNFWKTLVEGAFCGHGETYLNPREELWWSKGGVLVGQSPARLAFLKTIMDAAPADATVLPEKNTWGVEGEYYLTYLWDRQHATQSYKLPEGRRFKAEIIDTLAMTITAVAGALAGRADVALPIKPYLAIRLVRN